MCRSMADIRSTVAEIRRGKKERKKKERKKERKKLQGKNIMAPLLRRAAITNHSMKIYMVSLFHRATIKNRKRLSVPCYFLAPCDKCKHTAHGHQQAASQASTDSAWRHSVWLPHSSLGFQRPAGRRNYRLTPQARLWLRAIVARNTNNACQT